ncbi:MAG: TonB-dependent receptor, partial [Bacteroidetes bacterium]|nr:TonB-dependent receptor [Bacteroidota bacterium]
GYGIRSSSNDHYWKLRVGGLSHSDYLAGGGKRVPNSRMNGADLKTTYGWTRPNLSSQVNYDFSYYLFGFVENEAGKKEKEERIFARGAEEAHHAVNYHLLTTQNLFFVGKSKIGLDAAVHLNSRQEVEGKEEKAIGDLNLQLNTYTIRAKYMAPTIYATDFTGGVEVTVQSNTNDGKRVIIPDAGTRDLSGFVYAKHTLGGLILEESLRGSLFQVKTDEYGTAGTAGYFESLSRNYSVLNGSAGAAYAPNDQWLIKVNAASGYRAPNLAELSSNGLHEGTLNYEIGDKNLKAERNLEGDVSVTFRNDRTLISVSAFRNRFNDFIYLSKGASGDTASGGYQKYYFLQTDATFEGAEVSADWTPVHWMALRTTFATVVAKRSGGGYLPFIPADKWTAELVVRRAHAGFARDAEASVEIVKVFRQNRNADTENETPAYAVLNLALGGSVELFQRTARVTLGCNNLLDKKYFDHLSRIKPGGFSDPAVGFNNMGRNIYLMMAMPLSGS